MPKKSSKKVKKIKNKEVDESINTLLNDVSEHTRFFCVNGQYYKNLEELKKGLKSMDENSFQIHVNDQKNDFANWIYDCIGDIKLSQEIRELKDKEKITKKISSRITSIKRKLKGS